MYTTHFYQSEQGNEPALDWIRSLNQEQKKTIGEDIQVLQYRWPLGMPLVRKMDKDLWELRSKIKNGIARAFFTVLEKDHIILILHGFIKKSNKTPKNELQTAHKRLQEIHRRNKT